MSLLTMFPLARIVHACAGYTLALTLLTNHRIPISPILAILAALLLGVAKEIYDHFAEGETITSSIQSILVTTGGGVLAVLIHLAF